jgi:hypothetical protein
MSRVKCAAPTSTATLLAYWLQEVAGAEESDLEEHLFACEDCSARLRDLAQLGEGIKRVARAGTLHAVLSSSYVERLQRVGLRVRKYDVQPGGSVNCTATADDDLVVAYLRAPLEGVARLDLLVHDTANDARWRLEDIPFDPAAGAVVLAPSVVVLRRAPKSTQTMQLVAVAGGEERQIAEYKFHHTPSQAGI